MADKIKVTDGNIGILDMINGLAKTAISGYGDFLKFERSESLTEQKAVATTSSKNMTSLYIAGGLVALVAVVIALR